MSFKLKNLNEEETNVVRKCLECIATGQVILHDNEFQLIMGIEVAELNEILESWLDIDQSDEKVFLAINNSMINLLGYPHGCYHRWSEFMDIPLASIAGIHEKWRGDNIEAIF